VALQVAGDSVHDVPPRWRKITSKKAARLKKILDFLLKSPYASQKLIVKHTEIPRSTISGIRNNEHGNRITTKLKIFWCFGIWKI